MRLGNLHRFLQVFGFPEKFVRHNCRPKDISKKNEGHRGNLKVWVTLYEGLSPLAGSLCFLDNNFSDQSYDINLMRECLGTIFKFRDSTLPICMLTPDTATVWMDFLHLRWQHIEILAKVKTWIDLWPYVKSRAKDMIGRPNHVCKSLGIIRFHEDDGGDFSLLNVFCSTTNS